MQVHCDEGIANHIGPEPCAGIREDAGEASAHAGVPVAAGGLWFPRGGWVRPASLVDGLLAACGARLVLQH